MGLDRPPSCGLFQRKGNLWEWHSSEDVQVFRVQSWHNNCQIKKGNTLGLLWGRVVFLLCFMLVLKPQVSSVMASLPSPDNLSKSSFWSEWSFGLKNIWHENKIIKFVLCVCVCPHIFTSRKRKLYSHVLDNWLNPAEILYPLLN